MVTRWLWDTAAVAAPFVIHACSHECTSAQEWCTSSVALALSTLSRPSQMAVAGREKSRGARGCVAFSSAVGPASSRCELAVPAVASASTRTAMAILSWGAIWLLGGAD